MNDSLFRWLTLIIQGTGLVLLVFYGGRFIGEIKEVIKQLILRVEDLEESLDEQAKEITQLKINNARRH